MGIEQPTSEVLPEVSVLMPAYNAERFIGEAIRSCLAQTLEDFELIVVDDGSSDDTVRIAEEFRDPRVRVFRNTSNQGEAYARNRALDLARGRWIALLDADDLWDESRLEVMQSVGTRCGELAIVYDRMQPFVVDRSGRYRSLTLGLREGDDDVKAVPERIAPADFIERRLAGFPLFARSLAEVTEARHPEGIRVGADTAFQVQLLNAEGVEVFRVQRGLCRYRVHPGAASGSSDRLHELRRAYDFLLQECDLRKEIRRAVESRLVHLEREFAFQSLRESIKSVKWSRVMELVRADPSLLELFGKRILRSLSYRARLKAWGSEGRG